MVSKKSYLFAAVGLAGWLVVMKMAVANPSSDPNLPRPGLYRVDIDSTTSGFSPPGERNEIRSQSDSKTGDSRVTANRRYTQSYAGNPNDMLHCVAAVNTTFAPGMGNCKTSNLVQAAGSSTMEAVCPGGLKTSIAFKRIGKDVYEQRFQQEMYTSAPSSSALPDRATMEAMLANAPPGQRAELKKQIDEMYSPKRVAETNARMKEAQQSMQDAQAQLRQQMAQEKDPNMRAMMQQALMQLQGTQPVQKIEGKMMLTRVGDCK